MRKAFGFGLLTAVILIVIMSVGVAHPAFADGPYLLSVNTTTNVYIAPNVGAIVIGQLTAGQSWYILGTESTGKWVEVQITASVRGWAPKAEFNVGALTLPFIPGRTGGWLTSTPRSASAAVAATTMATTAAPPAVTVTPAAPATAQSIPVAVPYFVTVISTTNAYDAPSTKATVIGQLTAGQTWFVLGTDTTGKWTEVQVAGTATFFWTPTSTLSLTGVVLPVIQGVTGS